MADCIHTRERVEHDLPRITGRCVFCDPLPCPDCGQPDNAPCACYIDLATLPLADIKGLLALGDLSVDVVTPPDSEVRDA